MSITAKDKNRPLLSKPVRVKNLKREKTILRAISQEEKRLENMKFRFLLKGSTVERKYSILQSGQKVPLYQSGKYDGQGVFHEFTQESVDAMGRCSPIIMNQEKDTGILKVQFNVRYILFYCQNLLRLKLFLF